MTDSETQEYRVLARKYRPQNFDELIGQDALVRTLKNAIESGRIAHAFMLTGVRGVGKTTTARIIAKALNYTGADGNSGPTVGDTSDCSTCQAITEDRHPDILERDAASRNKVEQMRELLDGVSYAPTSARYKIYIIDEVHMLSTGAFNALLKTLEEPPAHVKFILATTEIRKVPVTILSRCQRFDLRRVDVPVLKDHFLHICGKEEVKAEDDALNMLAQAADGSVRDGLSLLDQAIALGASNEVQTADVVTMLGATDRVMILDLVEASLKAEAKQSLDIMNDLYRMGADAKIILQDMMNIIHGLSILAVQADARIDALPHASMDRAKEITNQLTAPQLQKAWQILMKGLGELHTAPNIQKAAEMIVLRLIYAANLPDPADLIKKLKNAPVDQRSVTQGRDDSVGGKELQGGAQLHAISVGGQAVAVQQVIQTQANVNSNPHTMQDMVAMFEANGEMLIGAHLYRDTAMITLKPGYFEFVPYKDAPADLAGKVRGFLNQWTDQNWVVSIGKSSESYSSLAQLAQQDKDKAQENIRNHPNVDAIFKTFPDAEIVNVYNKKEEN
jgi:DNA polymerase-3 subunit gamma/tau